MVKHERSITNVNLREGKVFRKRSLHVGQNAALVLLILFNKGNMNDATPLTPSGEKAELYFQMYTTCTSIYCPVIAFTPILNNNTV